MQDNQLTEITCSGCGGSGLLYQDPEDGSSWHRCCMPFRVMSRIAETLNEDRYKIPGQDLKLSFIQGWHADAEVMGYRKR